MGVSEGDKVTCVHMVYGHALQGCVLRVLDNDEFTVLISAAEFARNGVRGVTEASLRRRLREEGLDWCRGWEPADVAALQVARALADYGETPAA